VNTTKRSYPVEREAMRQLHLQIASARFDKLPALERAARRALKAVVQGEEAVYALDDSAADVLQLAEKFMIRIKQSDEDLSFAPTALGAAAP
jgi:urease accessory protein UreE